MIVVACDTCRLAGRCEDESEHRRLVLFGWFRDSSPDCHRHQPRWFRGLDGVIEHGRSSQARRGNG